MSYDRDKAIAYAREHCNGWDTRQFPDYDSDSDSNTSDCANFVSQCLHAGGAVMQRSDDNYADWWCERQKKGKCWAGAQSLRLALKQNKIQGISASSLPSPIGLKRGDIIFTPLREDRYKPKNNMRAGHVMMLAEDFVQDFISVYQRGCPKEQRFAKKKPDISNMIFYHIEGATVEESSQQSNTLGDRLYSLEQRIDSIERIIKEMNL